MAKGIQAEIKQSKPFSSLEEEAYISLLRTADQLQSLVADVLKLHGLSPTQFNALRILRGAGGAGLACSEIGDRMVNRDPDITRLLDRLERRGLVERSREQKDRRVITARITPEGLDVLKTLDRPIADFHRRSMRHISQPRIKSLVRLLEDVRNVRRD